jgi:triosephosphate isomerase
MNSNITSFLKKLIVIILGLDSASNPLKEIFMKTVVANWKMNGTRDLVDRFIDEINLVDSKNALVVCPPAVLIERFRAFRHSVGAQNCFCEDEGAFTGENSPKLLKEAGCEYVIVGHSERRAIFGETDELIFRKWESAVANELITIVCVGEKAEQRDRWKQTVSNQLSLFLSSSPHFRNDDGNGSLRCSAVNVSAPQDDDNGRELKNTLLNKTIVAYEPVWSIGAGLIPAMEEIETVLEFIRELL